MVYSYMFKNTEMTANSIGRCLHKSLFMHTQQECNPFINHDCTVTVSYDTKHKIKIWCSDSDVAEDSLLHALQTGKQLPTFARIKVASSSRVKQSKNTLD